MKKRREEEHENVERWMVSYADFVTLLFCFFTAMYAISNVDTNKLGKFVKSMRSAFHTAGPNGSAIAVIEGIQPIVPGDAEVESDVKDVLGMLISESKGGIDVRRDKRGVVISVMDKFIFESGFAKLREEARPVVDAVAKTLKTYPNMVRIEGHTDNIPISSGEFRSNWELSSTRAINVAKYFLNAHGIQPERISAIGYAEYRPVASNSTPDGRAKNRRVDIVILSEDEGKKEPQ
ncbi:MAG: OmpA family protein [Nitrospirae bacterium]|nr:OmpA family protein [Nitrospirota bacterium]